MVVRLGIDIGGSGIKGGPVDLDSGALIRKRVRIETPRPSHPEAVAGTIRRLVAAFPEATGRIGCAFPAIILSGRVNSAANVDDSWIGTDADRLFSETCGRPVVVINDADAAGLAEARVGAAAGREGVVIVLTLGTGIGSALLHNGKLVPNTELGHLELDGQVIEKAASNRARKREGLSFEAWAARLNDYLSHLERLFSPGLFVIGGGISKHFGEVRPLSPEPGPRSCLPPSATTPASSARPCRRVSARRMVQNGFFAYPARLGPGGFVIKDSAISASCTSLLRAGGELLVAIGPLPRHPHAHQGAVGPVDFLQDLGFTPEPPEDLSPRVRDQQLDLLRATGEVIDQAVPQIDESGPLGRRNGDCFRIQALEPGQDRQICQVGLVENQHLGDMPRPDGVEHLPHRADLTRRPGLRRVHDVE